MRYSLKNIFRNRNNTFSSSWFEIFETRFVLCIVIAAFSLLTPHTPNTRSVIALTIAYAAIISASGFLPSGTLQRKRIRAIPALGDVIFISSIVYYTGGQDSPWFLLYFFPIISVSRYLSYEGSLPLMAFTIAVYLLVAYISGPTLDYYTLALKCLIFLGIALVAGNLTKGSQGKERDLLEIFKEIDNAILDNTATNKVLRLILKKAQEFTRSDLAQMKILSTEYKSAYTISLESQFQDEWNIDALTKRYCEKSINSNKSFSILRIIGKKEKNLESLQDVEEVKKRHIYVFKAYTDGPESPAKSALFVPLILNEEVKAVIALYSQNIFHYSETEADKLQSFAPLLGITLKISEMYQEVTDSENEKKSRLKMLYEIGEQLKVEQGLAEIFKKVVELMYNQLNSEEASLFILNDDNLIEKVAVKGTSEEITEQLLEIEKPYKSGDSLIGEIFRDKKYKHLNHVPSDVEYQSEYSKLLLSQEVRHYIGVPLIIGEEVLGVIRVINKRGSPYYSTGEDTNKLSEKGFDEEDVELLQTIASQVASAIRSAKFIEVQRSYQELVENSPDPIIVLDKHSRVKIFNKACEKIWGFSAEEVKGQHVTKYYKSESHAKEIGDLLETSPDHRIQDYPAEIINRDGEIIPINLSASLLFDNEGEESGSIGVFKDLRETLRLQEEMMQAEKLIALGKLAHTVGHEIKHNIATGLNYLDTLAYESADDEELSEIYRDIQENLIEAVDKFQNMLMIGRPKPPEKRLISHKDIIRRVEDSLRRRAITRNIDFLVTSPQDAYELKADLEQLKQVLTNLFDNSLDAIAAKTFVDEKGRIELLAQACNGDLHLIWRDNGCGISDVGLSQLFTPFITSKPTGNGLGLFIIRNIIENHGGQISVESAEGKGTSFKIVLPLSLEDEPAE